MGISIALHRRDREDAGVCGRLRRGERGCGKSIRLGDAGDGFVRALRAEQRQPTRRRRPALGGERPLRQARIPAVSHEADSTWVHVAYTPCEGDKLQKTEFADQNGDGIDEAFVWIKYDTFDGADVSGSQTHLYVVDGRSGSILLHGLVAATASEPPDKGRVRLEMSRTSPGRLTLTTSAKADPSRRDADPQAQSLAAGPGDVRPRRRRVSSQRRRSPGRPMR